MTRPTKLGYAEGGSKGVWCKVQTEPGCGYREGEGGWCVVSERESAA